MTHKIFLAENELKDLIASHFQNATRDTVSFEVKEGQRGMVVSASICYVDDLVLLTSRNTQCC